MTDQLKQDLYEAMLRTMAELDVDGTVYWDDDNANDDTCLYKTFDEDEANLFLDTLSVRGPELVAMVPKGYSVRSALTYDSDDDSGDTAWRATYFIEEVTGEWYELKDAARLILLDVRESLKLVPVVAITSIFQGYKLRSSDMQVLEQIQDAAWPRLVKLANANFSIRFSGPYTPVLMDTGVYEATVAINENDKPANDEQVDKKNSIKQMVDAIYDPTVEQALEALRTIPLILECYPAGIPEKNEIVVETAYSTFWVTPLQANELITMLREAAKFPHLVPGQDLLREEDEDDYYDDLEDESDE